MKLFKNIFLKTILAVMFFTALGVIAVNIPYVEFSLRGTDANFGFFDSFGPAMTGVLGMGAGLVVIFISRFVEFVQNGFSLELVEILRFLPVLFGGLYFVAKREYKNNLMKKFSPIIISFVVPALCMLAFIVHPTGRQVWYYSLYWLIPMAAYFFHEKSTFIRSLGATFAQHAVGGALFIWAVPIPAEVWMALVPVVIVERLIIAGGMTLTYEVILKVKEVLQKQIQEKLNFT
jgi:hypothetical protein